MRTPSIDSRSGSHLNGAQPRQVVAVMLTSPITDL